MYSIGEFSKITRLTAKALRYYDEEGLLIPSCRGPNGYRLYDEADFARAERIALLRELDFSIAEIREILTHCESAGDLSYYLQEKQGMIARQIERERKRMEQIGLYLHPVKQEAVEMKYEIAGKELPPQTMLSVRFQGKYPDVGRYIGGLYREAKGKAAGPPFCLYYDEEYRETADIELCLPTRGLLSESKATARELPGARVLCVTHTGSYETINLAYKALLDAARERGLRCLAPSREIYRKGPGLIFKGNPNRYVTEIAIPVEEEIQHG